jgi:hypothetical protein
MKDTKTAFKWIINLLQKKNIPFQIAMGLAARLYGSSRDLADIDIFVPDNKLELILPDVKNYIKTPLRHYQGRLWDIKIVALEYKGQWIELLGATNIKVFDKKNKQWSHVPTDFSKSETKEIFGMKVPVMTKKQLLDIKGKLLRRVDELDIKEIQNTKSFPT